jgi:hypothetical protein
MGDIFNDMRDERRRLRAEFGVPCPLWRVKQPKREPTILLPAQRCKVDGYRDPRPRVDGGGRDS